MLQRTRLGKYVNEMRRKTNDRELAKRARSLVRKWQHLVDTRVNGERIATESRGAVPHGGLPPHLHGGSSGSQPSSPASQPLTPSSVKSTHSPSLPSRSRPDTPTTGGRLSAPPGAQTKNQRTDSSQLAMGRPGTPGLLDSNSKPASPALGGSLTSPGLPTPGRVHISSTPIPDKAAVAAGSAHNHQLSTPTSTLDSHSKFDSRKRRHEPDAACELSRKRLLVDPEGEKLTDGAGPMLNGTLTESHSVPSQLGSNGRCDSPVLSTSVVGDSSELKFDNSRLNSSSKKNSMTPLIKADSLDKSKGAVNKTPKVATTAQLLQKLDFKLPGSDTVSKIANNQIEKEYDPDNISIVPAGAKPRPRRKPGTVIPPSSCDSSLQQTKTEMVQKFLQSSVTPSTSELDMAGSFKYDMTGMPDSPGSIDVTGVSDHSGVNSSGSVTMDNHHSQLAADTQHSHSTTLRNNDSQARPVMFFIGDEEATNDGAGAKDASHHQQQQTMVAENAPEIDPWEALPPLRMADLVWPTQDQQETERPKPTEKTVDQLHDEQLPGVNGQKDYLGEWKNWTQTYSLPTYNGDLLHVLPYVNLDD